MNSFSIFPDINVLLALTVLPHPEHATAQRWFDDAQPTELLVCRASQLSFLRLLTQRSALGDETLTNEDAWLFYDRLMASGLLRYIEEPASLLSTFRSRSGLSSASPTRWMDAYLSAVASVAGLRLVTFDKALHRYTPRSILIST